MKVGDLVIDGTDIWRIDGVYLGAVGTEDLIELVTLTQKPGYVGMKTQPSSIVPRQLIRGKVYTRVD